MQRRTPLFIVTSSRPRVGKTLIACALTEYFCAQNRPVAAFDVNPDEFKLIDRFFSVMQQIDFAAEVRRRAIVPMVLFVADPDERSRQGYAMLKARFPDLPLVLVLNESVQRAGAYRANFPPTRLGGEAISIPALTPVVRSVVDRRNFSFVGYVQKTNDTTSELYEWMGRVFISFRELEVRLLLGEITPQLRHSA